MRLKADWPTYLRRVRRREFELIFDHLPAGSFRECLELGAGDGFQTVMLLPYAQRLVSTDFRRPPDPGNPRIEVRELPAEQIADVFGPARFDLVYSSNLFEHLPDPAVALAGIHYVLTDGGITIHVMPNRIWKLSQLALWLPSLITTTGEDLRSSRNLRTVTDRIRRGAAGSGTGAEKNNPTVVRARRTIIAKILVPDPHGVSLSHRAEFAAFAQGRWTAELRRAGFEVVAVLRGPFSSGYGFGLWRLTRVLERCRISSEYVYVAKKAGYSSAHERHFHGTSQRPRSRPRSSPDRITSSA